MSKSVAIVGSESLLGRELREVLSDKWANQTVTLIGAEETGGILTQDAKEAAFIAPLEREHLMDAGLAFMAGPGAATWKVLDLLSDTGRTPALVDLSFALEDRPEARLRAPMIEPGGYDVAATAIHVIAHPAAITIALFLDRLHGIEPVARSVIQIFEPASERGRRGLDELHQQTVNLFSFKPMPKEVFDAQLGFNMLPRYGTEAAEKLQDVEVRIDRHLATLLGIASHAPLPSLRLVQAPVFHGYSISAWVEFAAPPSIARFRDALASPRVEVRDDGLEPPSNVGAAGQSGITLGAIEADRNNPRACWFWVVADNLRISAENAVMVARDLLARGGGSR